MGLVRVSGLGFRVLGFGSTQMPPHVYRSQMKTLSLCKESISGCSGFPNMRRTRMDDFQISQITTHG